MMTESRNHVAEFALADGGGTLVILGTPFSFWIQLAAMLMTQAVVASVFAVIIYHYVILEKRCHLLCGFGFVIPTVVYIPIYFVRAFSIQNISLMVDASAIAVIIPFACMEAMFDMSPIGVDDSLVSYVGYLSPIIPLQRRDGRPIQADWNYYRHAIWMLVIKFTAVTLCNSYMMHCNYVLFPAGGEHHWLHCWKHLLNNLNLAILTWLDLEAGTAGVGFGVSLLSGCKVIQMMKNPIFGSTSPSDFWCNRWNLMQHGYFKRDVYKPLLKNGFSKPVGIVATFVASGVLHEYVCYVISFKNHNLTAELYVPNYGNHFKFFA